MEKTELEKLGAINTVGEVKQQPQLWKEALKNYLTNKDRIDTYLAMIASRHQKVRVIFTGAGTSAYVGDTVVPYLKGKVDELTWELVSVPTTDIVSNPYEYLNADIPTLLLSFGRSGNSPESMAAVDLGKKMIKDFYQLTITCAKDGVLAKKSEKDEKNLLFLMPEGANDKGFAMTGSYTCMVLSTLFIFDPKTNDEKGKIVEALALMGEDVIGREEEIKRMVDLDFNRVIYLGSGSLAGMTREAGLKLLELTAGKIAMLFDSSLGFRHGPKSFVDEKTLVFVFTSNHPHTRKYDLDILDEVKGDQIAKYICSLTVKGEENFAGSAFSFDEADSMIPDAYMALPYVMFAQVLAVMAALKVGNRPDTPSPTGTVNRVVKGVNIHPYED